MRVREVKCKTALSSSSLPGLDYSLNPYRGCQHNCIYCYVPNVLRIKRIDWGSFVDVKTNIPVVLSDELRKKKPGVVALSTVTDPYQPIEKKYKVTRYCLEQLLRYDFPICIQTKSSLIMRDIDIISSFSNIDVMMSIATFNDDERKILEPYSSPIKERLNILKNFSDEGVKTSVFFGPIYPTINKEEIPVIIDAFIDVGVSEIMIDCFNLKPGISENLKKNIQKDPFILDRFTKYIFNKNNYYNELRGVIKQIGKEKNVKIVDAFS